MKWVVFAMSAAVLFWIYRTELPKIGALKGAGLTCLVVMLTLVVNKVHSFNVDHATNYFPSVPSEVWQESLQKSVMNLDPSALPHSYRFLPNSIVRWMELGGLSYSSARDYYRLLFGLVLFYAIYRYARLYVTFPAAVLTMVLVAVIYPVSFELYAGQLTDPVSHLSFVLALIFTETAEFSFLLATLIIGSLAKETVLAMAGYYFLFQSKDKAYVRKSVILITTSLFVYFGVRVYVLRGVPHYKQVSGVTLSQLRMNLADGDWPSLFLLTACTFLPFLLLGWRTTPLPLKRQALYLLPVLFLSSLFFSWLHEGRNYMPLAVVLAVVAARFFSSPPDSNDTELAS